MTPRWIFIGSLIVWLTLLAPPLTVIAWINSWPLALPLTLAAILAPVVLVIVMRELQADASRSKWYWMQCLGAGAVLLPIVAVGLILRVFIDAPIVGLLALATWLVVAPLAWRNANKIHNKQLNISSVKIRKPVRLVQISDVHVGSRSAAYLGKIVDQVLSHKPDFVVITGDLLDSSSVDAQQLENLSRIQCPTFMCLGNHERYVNLGAAIKAIETHQVTILRDQAIMHNELRIVGMDDRDIPDALPEVLSKIGHSDQHFNIVLYHRPDGWDAIRQHQYELTLAGHTHGGQIWPFGHLVKKKYPQMLGWFENGEQALYVSPGTGTWGPIFRLGTRCEMTVIDLAGE